MPPEYLAREDAFLDVGRWFLRAAGPRRLKYRYFNVFEGFPQRRDPVIHPLVYDTLGSTLDEIEYVVGEGGFQRLNHSQKVLVMQLAARDLASFCVVSNDGMTLASMDDGFYWFVSLPEGIEPADVLVQSNRITLSPSIDIFDDA